MKFVKNLCMGIGAVSLAAVLLTLVAPKAVHAAVATLVEIANTAANPVPNTDVNAPGEEPLQTELCSAIGGSGCPTDVPSSFVVPTTTSDGLVVKRLVIEAVGVTCINSGVTQFQPSIQALVNENQVSGWQDFDIVFPIASSPGSSFTGSIMPVKAYADPGTTVFTNINNGSAVSPIGVTCLFNVTAYFLTH
jgi:hypothetical protein